MLTFVKLGGSLITDKQVEASFREAVASRLAVEIADTLKQNQTLQLLIGHGSGSFGHFAAKRHQTIDGVQTPEQWKAFAEVATVAAELNYLMAKTLQTAGVPVWRLQPSASAISHDGVLVGLAIEPIRRALQNGLVPLVYGDVCLDAVRGGTIISTETIFFYLAQQVPVKRIVLLGEVDGVYDCTGEVIPSITPANFEAVATAVGGSAGTDVTGGMETKVRDMLALAQRIEGLTIRIMNGTQPGLLHQVLLNQVETGTLISGG